MRVTSDKPEGTEPERREAPRRFASQDPNDNLDLVMPRARRGFELFTRAARLRCPNCGRGPVMQHWFKMRVACGTCGLLIERGESDYFIGSILANLVLGEMLFAIVFVGVLIATWPTPPWDTLQFAAPIGAVLAPAVLFPFSKLFWLAGDLLLRPDASA